MMTKVASLLPKVTTSMGVKAALMKKLMSKLTAMHG